MICFSAEFCHIDYDGYAQYSIEENSFYYEPWNDVDFSIIIGKGYSSLDLNLDTFNVLQLTGFNPRKNWVSQALAVPKSKTGILKAHISEDQQKGSGLQYVDDWETYYDEKSGWICIGNPQCKNGLTVEFAENTLAVIVDSELKAVWIRPKFI